jgi:hypothetical protein
MIVSFQSRQNRISRLTAQFAKSVDCKKRRFLSIALYQKYSIFKNTLSPTANEITKSIAKIMETIWAKSLNESSSICAFPT